ncbi:zinc finger protein 362a [Electrophorus electricus]|uniref:C2H2-type domain-containing protein n=1 Tax=Electrophorus electricus TaxID=8005 RepID=A0A4W4EPY9_ELEEL|nr:zinc finger protein 362a [Electrophorus electricus]XP_026851866.1 zinc finger protein 362a [Electrophorus electricus]XP_026851867.1 zinc finger protein 362a [Electrophorus electricus]XP_026851868.1 zinc finger protein 362a [Electrophorus electricus]
MAEPRFNNPYFWPPHPTMPAQLDNLVLINKIKEQLMAEKIRPPHLPPTSVASQQPLLVPPTPAEGGQHGMAVAKLQQAPGLHSHSPAQPDIVLHARTAPTTVAGRILGDVNLNLDDKTALKARGLWEDWHLRQIIDQPSRANHLSGIALSSRSGNHSTSEANTPATPTLSSSQARHGGTSSPNLISGLASGTGMEAIKTGGGLAGLLGPPPKTVGRGRKKIKAESPSGPLLVVPYPILASGADQSTVTITTKEGKTYRCKVCPLTFFSKSDMQIHSKSHTEAKPHKCPHCTKSFANASYLAQHLRIHLGVKPYHCSYCEKSFRQLSHLQQHTRIHTGDRPYKCIQPGCDKAFTQLSNLQSHQRSHNKDKPYKCSNCYRAYSDSASLQIHLAAHAIKNAKAYCCSMCGRAYTSETYLMKHMSKHTVVEHLVSQHSPPRADSPSIPIRISLI